MKRIVVCGLMSLLALSAALPASADPGGDRRPPAGGRPGGGGGGPRPGGPGSGGGVRPMPGRPSPGPGGHRPSHPVHRPSPGPVHRPSPGHGHKPPFRPGNRPIYGWNGHRFHAGAFRYPTGFGYRRWSIGQSLPSLLFSSAYYFTNYTALGLDAPPWGYQWVRYGPDVLLVNIRSGEVLDVIHNAFY